MKRNVMYTSYELVILREAINNKFSVVHNTIENNGNVFFAQTIMVIH